MKAASSSIKICETVGKFEGSWYANKAVGLWLQWAQGAKFEDEKTSGVWSLLRMAEVGGFKRQMVVSNNCRPHDRPTALQNQKGKKHLIHVSRCFFV